MCFGIAFGYHDSLEKNTLGPHRAANGTSFFFFFKISFDLSFVFPV